MSSDWRGGGRKGAAVVAQKGDALRTLLAIGLAFFAALLLRTFVVQPFTIPSSSMESTLLVGDYMVVEKYAYGYTKYSFPFDLWGLWGGSAQYGTPKRGDVVVFRLPTDDSLDYVKRVVGLPGDVVEVWEGRVFVDGELLVQERLEGFEAAGLGLVDRYKEEAHGGGREYEVLDLYESGDLDDAGRYEVPEGHIFVMGDNRDNSLDSRTGLVGYVPLKNVVGRGWIVAFSWFPEESLWKFWSWGSAFRGDRFLRLVH